MLSSLASLASGRDLVVSGKERAAAGREEAAPELPIELLIARAHGLCGGALDPASDARVEDFRRAFDSAARGASPLNAFVFHVDLPAGSRIDYVDARFDPSQFDYLDILARSIGRLRGRCPGIQVYLVTSAGSRYVSLTGDGVAVIALPIDGRQPMYDRASALLAYVRSSAFTADTVALDSDVVVNRPLGDAFSLGFDIGLTYRNAGRLMPVNEGVIFLSARDRAAVARFLYSRLAAYDRIAVDPEIVRYYGDVRRWRGGQLSLNALVHPLRPFSPYARELAGGARVRFLPCDTFNFTVAEGEAASSLETLDERYVVHFKGWRKLAFRFAARHEAPG